MGKVYLKKAREKEIGPFYRREWKTVDLEHYGRPIKWFSQEFVFKAVEKGKIVGAIKAKYEAGVVCIKNLIVAKDKRGQGIGRKLMAKVERAGKKLGAHKIYLFTGKTWPERRFYEKLRYKKTGDLTKHFFKKDFVIYSKHILP